MHLITRPMIQNKLQTQSFTCGLKKLDGESGGNKGIKVWMRALNKSFEHVWRKLLITV